MPNLTWKYEFLDGNTLHFEENAESSEWARSLGVHNLPEDTAISDYIHEGPVLRKERMERYHAILAHLQDNPEPEPISSDIGILADYLSRVEIINPPSDTDHYRKCSGCSKNARVYNYRVMFGGLSDSHLSRRGYRAVVINQGWFRNDGQYAYCARCVSIKAVARLFSGIIPFNQTRIVLVEDDFLYMREGCPTERTGVVYDAIASYGYPETDQMEPASCPCGQYIFTHQSSHALEIATSDGTTQYAHRGCSLTCHKCETAFFAGGPWAMLTAQSNIITRQFYRVDDEDTCENCFRELQRERDYNACDYCQNHFHQLRFSEDRQRDLCNRCYDQEIECNECGYGYAEGEDHECYRRSNRNIYDYSHKPRPRFYGTGKYWLGFELEVEARDPDETDEDDVDKVAGDVTTLLDGRAYCKYDGSLDLGFEVVTHPHTLENYHTEFMWSFLDTLRNNKMVSWNNENCGFHVHISNTAFTGVTKKQTEMHRIRFAKFIYDNQYQVERIAGRTANDFARFGDTGMVVPKILLGRQNEGRYEVVNISNRNTIEIRIFKGSLRKERLLSNIEFVHAVCEFTRDMKVVPKDKPLSWSRFVAFVVSHDSDYQNLITIINEAFASERIKAEI